MKIKSVTPSKHVKERYIVTMEGGEIIRADLNVIARFDLYSGRELSEEELAELREDSGRAMAKAKALRIMGSRNMSRREITRRLVRGGEDPQVADDTADWLERVGAVNDGQYAGMIARHYGTLGYGPERVKNELYKRGIPKELWEDALAELPEAEDAAYEALCKRLGESATREEVKKGAQALVRRGFGWEDARQAAARYEREHEISREEEAYE